LLLTEGGLCTAELELRQEIIQRQETFEPVPLFSRWIDDEHCWRPLHAVASANPFPLVRLIANVNPDRDEMIGDEPNDPFVGVHLGIQPSAAASHRSGGEIGEHVARLRLRVRERALEIVPPRNTFRRCCLSHIDLPFASVFRLLKARIADPVHFFLSARGAPPPLALARRLSRLARAAGA
jgi:hypothetical protein